MKHNTFEPCKDHENGHFGWCLLCEIKSNKDQRSVLLCEISNLKEEIKKLNNMIDMYKRT